MARPETDIAETSAAIDRTERTFILIPPMETQIVWCCENVPSRRWLPIGSLPIKTLTYGNAYSISPRFCHFVPPALPSAKNRVGRRSPFASSRTGIDFTVSYYLFLSPLRQFAFLVYGLRCYLLHYPAWDWM